MIDTANKVCSFAHLERHIAMVAFGIVLAVN
jgi:hypothetical protein